MKEYFRDAPTSSSANLSTINPPTETTLPWWWLVLAPCLAVGVTCLLLWGVFIIIGTNKKKTAAKWPSLEFLMPKGRRWPHFSSRSARSSTTKSSSLDQVRSLTLQAPKSLSAKSEIELQPTPTLPTHDSKSEESKKAKNTKRKLTKSNYSSLKIFGKPRPTRPPKVPTTPQSQSEDDEENRKHRIERREPHNPTIDHSRPFSSSIGKVRSGKQTRRTLTAPPPAYGPSCPKLSSKAVSRKRRAPKSKSHAHKTNNIEQRREKDHDHDDRSQSVANTG